MRECFIRGHRPDRGGRTVRPETNPLAVPHEDAIFVRASASGVSFRHDPQFGMSLYSNWKTETIERKCKQASAKTRRSMIAELCWRDPVRTRAFLEDWLEDTTNATKRQSLRRCLMSVADPTLARELFEEPFFNPNELALTGFIALLDDFLDDLPTLGEPERTHRLERLGFTGSEAPNPKRDMPAGSDEFASSPERYEEALARFIRGLLQSPFEEWGRPKLEEHLRQRLLYFATRTYHAVGFRTALEEWRVGRAPPLLALSVVDRLGVEATIALLGNQDFERLVREACDALALPTPSQEAELAWGFLPQAAGSWPSPLGDQIVLSVLKAKHLSASHLLAVKTLLSWGERGRKQLLAVTLPAETAQTILGAVSFDDAATLIERNNLDPTLLNAHPAIASQASAFERARSIEDPIKQMELLAEVAAAPGQPRAHEAFTQLTEFAETGDVNTREHALYHLGQLGDPKALPLLRAALDDPSLSHAVTLINTAIQRCSSPRKSRE